MSSENKVVVFGFVGDRLDAGKGPKRWERWRPTVSIGRYPDLLVHRVELWHQLPATAIAEVVADDIRQVSPTTEVNCHPVDLADPWDFEEVFAALHDFAIDYPFDVDGEDYLFHITTGTHVVQICSFLLTESRHFPARLLQTSPPTKRERSQPGEYRIIDLDLSRYDRLAARFSEERRQGISLLKSGIETRNEAFNRTMERIEQVALASTEPILLQGPTGAGKTRLARQIYQLRRRRNLVEGPFVEVNCATLRGDGAMSALFGHRRGAYTGATEDRRGLLRRADEGVLFLDEVGELGADEQAMLLRAIEIGRFLPLGSDEEVRSRFQLICGTNRDLRQAVRDGAFREDLLARINLWTFTLPGLRDRPEDIEPNLEFELEQFRARTGSTVRFNSAARHRFLEFATGPEGRWPENFRGLGASITRQATLAAGGRIDVDLVNEEIESLRRRWGTGPHGAVTDQPLEDVVDPDILAEMDLFDRIQLVGIIDVCRRCSSLSEAGRTLFAQSRKRKASTNDADRLRKYLRRYGVDWKQIVGNAR